MDSDWESNQWPFGLQAGPQSTNPHQPGLHSCSNLCNSVCILSSASQLVLATFQVLSISYMWLVITIFLFSCSFSKAVSFYTLNVEFSPTCALGCVFKMSVGNYTIYLKPGKWPSILYQFSKPFSCLHLHLFLLKFLLFMSFFMSHVIFYALQIS